MTKNINDKKAKVYGVIQNKGGVLKSTICTNMASELSLQGKKVLIIDVDNQSNVLYSFGLNPDAYETDSICALILPPVIFGVFRSDTQDNTRPVSANGVFKKAK